MKELRRNEISIEKAIKSYIKMQTTLVHDRFADGDDRPLDDSLRVDVAQAISIEVICQRFEQGVNPLSKVTKEELLEAAVSVIDEHYEIISTVEGVCDGILRIAGLV